MNRFEHRQDAVRKAQNKLKSIQTVQKTCISEYCAWCPLRCLRGALLPACRWARGSGWLGAALTNADTWTDPARSGDQRATPWAVDGLDADFRAALAGLDISLNSVEK